jgi:hypothetical protein
MIKSLVWTARRGVDLIAFRNWRKKNIRTAELKVRPPGRSKNVGSEMLSEPFRRLLHVGCSDVNVIPR